MKQRDYFKFLEGLTVGTEVLTTATGDRIYTVVGLSDKRIVLSNQKIFNRETGEIDTRKKDEWLAIKELTLEEKQRIQAEEELRQAEETEKQKKLGIQAEYDRLVGIEYRCDRPSTEVQLKVIELIKSLRA